MSRRETVWNIPLAHLKWPFRLNLYYQSFFSFFKPEGGERKADQRKSTFCPPLITDNTPILSHLTSKTVIFLKLSIIFSFICHILMDFCCNFKYLLFSCCVTIERGLEEKKPWLDERDGWCKRKPLDLPICWMSTVGNVIFLWVRNITYTTYFTLWGNFSSAERFHSLPQMSAWWWWCEGGGGISKGAAMEM